jgi:hypothetical protein
MEHCHHPILPMKIPWNTVTIGYFPYRYHETLSLSDTSLTDTNEHCHYQILSIQHRTHYFSRRYSTLGKSYYPIFSIKYNNVITRSFNTDTSWHCLLLPAGSFHVSLTKDSHWLLLSAQILSMQHWNKLSFPTQIPCNIVTRSLLPTQIPRDPSSDHVAEEGGSLVTPLSPPPNPIQPNHSGFY